MEYSRYTISQAAEILEVRESQLRYWEDELELRVHRNGQGHRYYTGYELQMFRSIKELKKDGLQLRAIRERIPQIAMKAPGSTESKIKLIPMKSSNKAEAESGTGTEKEILASDKMKSFHCILERMIEQEIHRREAEEVRFRALDKRIREYQLTRKEAALTLVKRKVIRDVNRKDAFS